MLYHAAERVGKEKVGRWIDCSNKKRMKACSFALLVSFFDSVCIM